MINVRIQVIGARPIYDRYGRAMQVGDRVTRQANLEMTQHVVSILRRFTPVGATGNLRNSTKGILSKTPQGYRSLVVQDARSGGGFSYQEVVNRGSRPHFPPPAALVAWVRAKWGLTGRAAVAGAWRLAVHISKRGTRPNPYVDKAMAVARPGLRAIGRRMGVYYRSMLTRG